MSDQDPHVAYTTKLHNTQSNQAGKVYEEYSTSLDRSSPPPALLTPMQVRRLTPRECERLQGFPDDYTRIPTWNGWRKLDASETPEQLVEEGLEVKQNKKTGKWRVKDVDGPRYKALGNSWAVNCPRWIGRRIAMVDALQLPQLAVAEYQP
jgi:DNA (cytosine-5)-methyltransferase 1